MASITYDGQSFMVDGRRIWVVGGSVEYSMLPRASWEQRILEAKCAGLNTIATRVVWARHEPMQGAFDWSGENDLRHFVELVGKAGMHLILRPGPFVGGGIDIGGIPSWLTQMQDIKLRAGSQNFLESCSKYITALAQQVRDLQVTSVGAGGPILMVQNESGWSCGDDDAGHAYLRELNRYLRESGFTVPTINTNDLWQTVEGEIECWRGFDNLLAHLRQLGEVRPDQPKLVMELGPDHTECWGDHETKNADDDSIMIRIGEVLAAGGQFNIEPFVGGTRFRFEGGRDPKARDRFCTTRADLGASIDCFGRRTAQYGPVKRVCTFASHFARVLANIEPDSGVVLHPAGTGTGASVVHSRGPQGDVVWVFGQQGGARGKDKVRSLLTSDGSILPIDMRGQSLAWVLRNVRLNGRAHLDYCSLCALGYVGKTLVCFGPGGASGELSINGSRLEVTVPSRKLAETVEHEGLTIVVVNDTQADRVQFSSAGVFIGVGALDMAGEPVLDKDTKQYQHVSPEGVLGVQRVAAPAQPAPRRTSPKLGGWRVSACDPYLAGSTDRYADFAGPQSLVELGAPSGYGWYRMEINNTQARRVKVLAAPAGHRLHTYTDGEPACLMGVGPGADRVCTLSLKKGKHTMVVLAENLGRYAGGLELGEPTGIAGPLWVVSAMRPGKPKIEHADPVDPLSVRVPVWNVHRGDTTDPARLTWTIQHRRKSPIILDMDRVKGSGVGVLLVNDKPVRVFAVENCPPIVLGEEELSRGKNVIQITMMGSTESWAGALGAISFFEGTEDMLGKSRWAFAKWELPHEESYQEGGKRLSTGGTPAWFRGEFKVADEPEDLVLDASGLTKGQIYVNDTHVCRYFVATKSGSSVKQVGPQTSHLIPASLLRPGAVNTLTLFDEHGASPARAKLSPVH